MQKHTGFDFTNRATRGGASASAKSSTGKATRKSKRAGSIPTKKRRPRDARQLHRASGIRETEEARALLEKQLHSLYWWIFNACKMKGFIRAKGLSEAAERQRNAGSNARSSSPKE